MPKIKHASEIKNIEKIPNLPVPSLEETKERWENWIEPLAKFNDFDFKIIKKESKDFMESKIIEDSQKFLIKKSMDKDKSYIIDWWIDSYLNYRGNLLNVGAAITWGNEKTKSMSQVERCAFIAYSISMFYLNYKTKPEAWKVLKLPKSNLSLDQLEGLLASYRKMESGEDEYIIHDGIASNVLFMYKNSPYLIKTIVNNKVVSLNSIKNTIEKIINSHNLNNENIANYLELSFDRENDSALWKKIYKDNQESYNKIINSIFSLNFDSKIETNNHVNIIKGAFEGDGNEINRWLGKSINISVNKTYESSITMEHTFFDGASFLVLLGFLDELIKKQEFSGEELHEYELIKFKIDSKDKLHLKKIKDEFLKLSKNVYFSEVNINIGRDEIKKMGIKSADAFVQLLGQLSQYKTFKSFYSTYEAVDMRNFFRGRTECIRPLSNEIIEFAKVYFKEKTSEYSLKELFSNVENKHYEKVKLCKAAKGLHRHMMGLELAAKELGYNQKLPIISHKYYSELAGNRMSTSTIPFKTITQFSFWPVQEGGFTMGYKIGENSIFIDSTSYIKNKKLLNEFHKNIKIISADLISYFK